MSWLGLLLSDLSGLLALSTCCSLPAQFQRREVHRELLIFSLGLWDITTFFSSFVLMVTVWHGRQEGQENEGKEKGWNEERLGGHIPLLWPRHLENILKGKKKKSYWGAAWTPIWRQSSDRAGAASLADSLTSFPSRTTASLSTENSLSLPPPGSVFLFYKRQFRSKEVALPKITDQRSKRNPRWLSEPSVLSTIARTSTSTWLTGPFDFLIFSENLSS